MRLALRLAIPHGTRAILWDMDGVLIDSLKLAIDASNRLLAERFGPEVQVSAEFIRGIFAYHTTEFWRRILEHVTETYALPEARQAHADLLAAYDRARLDSRFELNPGIDQVLGALEPSGLKSAVVSNNPTEEVKINLERAGILHYFDVVIGNDLEKLEKKPAPDTYLFAAEQLGVAPEHCVVVEDSLLGAEAGDRAGCYVAGVATGSAGFEELERSPYVRRVYQRFEALHIELDFGDVRDKRISTPNEFVSHMVEHIAWRLGLRLHLHWPDNDWQALGAALGERLRTLEQGPFRRESAALGMIDDGSAEVSIDLNREAGLELHAIDSLDLDWFRGLRCEQLDSGEALIQLMQGLADGLHARLSVRVCNVEDPHHTWEGVFRAIGIAASRMFTPPQTRSEAPEALEVLDNEGELRVSARSLSYASVFRGTAESHVAAAVDFTRQRPHEFSFQVAPTIDVSGLPQLLRDFADAAGFTLQVEFKATVLSSSHVVLEDTALVVGRALLEILNLRMQAWGVNGAGSNLRSATDFARAVRVGLSVEGRKFWRFVPFQGEVERLRKDFLLGQTLDNNLRSEDLDDFVDGLAGGLACSIMVHLAELPAPQAGWQQIFEGLGTALREVFAYNPYRKGVPPGVKATLA